MAGATQLVPAKIVDQNEYDVGLNTIRGARRALAGCGYWESRQQRQQKQFKLN
jgi:hypothetical protein